MHLHLHFKIFFQLKMFVFAVHSVCIVSHFTALLKAVEKGKPFN